VQRADVWRLLDPAGNAVGEFRLLPPDRVHWDRPLPAERSALPTAVLAEILRRWPVELLAQPLEICLDTAAFTQTARGQQQKLGLGSSAALVAALAAAVLAACHLEPAVAELRALCLDAHRAFQLGRGSGVDVLTAIHGGLLICTPAGSDLHAEPLHWPQSLQLVVAWTGHAASTPALIERFDAFRARQAAVFDQHAGRLVRAANTAAQAWRSGNAATILDAVAGYADRLRAVDSAGKIGIWTAEHDAYERLAAAAGAVYKSSGAGGGDLGYALTDSSDVADELRAALAKAGGITLDLPPGQPGLSVVAA
jgi:mevalonate kinase